MSRLFFISLPVADVTRSTAFYTALGFATNPQFTGEGGACIVISEAVQVMLATRERLSQLTTKEISDPRTSTGALLSFTCSSKEELTEMVSKAVASGGSTDGTPDDYGFMYQHHFYDPDGHGWGLTYFGSMPEK